MARRSEITGMDELIRAVNRMGKVPQKVSTRAARAGATIAHKAVKAEAPEDEGDLKNALVIRREKKKKQGKTVYDVIVDPDKSDVFVKPVENPSPYNRGNDPTRAYYPASQEYGYMTPNGRLIPGFRYFRKSFDANETKIEDKIIDVGVKEIDKAWEAR